MCTGSSDQKLPPQIKPSHSPKDEPGCTHPRRPHIQIPFTGPDPRSPHESHTPTVKIQTLRLGVRAHGTRHPETVSTLPPKHSHVRPPALFACQVPRSPHLHSFLGVLPVKRERVPATEQGLGNIRVCGFVSTLNTHLGQSVPLK